MGYVTGALRLALRGSETTTGTNNVDKKRVTSALSRIISDVEGIKTALAATKRSPR